METEKYVRSRGHLITSVAPGSIAEELEIKPGDRLLSIDGHEISDVFDYRFYVNSAGMNMLVLKEDGEEWEFDIEHNYEDIGLDFDLGLMSECKSCTNKCVFCFIDQMPPGMRETLYFKDDDSRLSFLQGNYVTLTNMNINDIKRIIEFKLAPINISVHTTNPKLRVRMLHNKYAGSSLKYIDMLYKHNIPMNGQIVMCKGYNDGKELERTIRDLIKYVPVMESLSVVPVGITKFRKGLARLEPIDRESACETIDIIEKYQKTVMEKHGIHFVHASDEFYLLAGRKIPEESRYDGYIQLENGVGMLRLLRQEVKAAIKQVKTGYKNGRYKSDKYKGHKCKGGMAINMPSDAGGNHTGRYDDMPQKKRVVSIATGMLPSDTISELAGKVEAAFGDIIVKLYTIKNDFFGNNITVTGLITGGDLIKQLKGKILGERLLLSVNMFRSGEEVFLDDLSRADVEKELGVKVVIVGRSGYDFVSAILDDEYTEVNENSAYEPEKL